MLTPVSVEQQLNIVKKLLITNAVLTIPSLW